MQDSGSIQKNLLEFLMSENEITWQSIIQDLINNEELDPWDVDISILSNRYLQIVKSMQESNLFISGKVLLASALLLKLKADRLLSEGIGNLDNLMFPPDNLEELGDFVDGKKRIKLDVDPVLTIKTPQARKRKVTVNELIFALEKALEVNNRRLLRIADRDSIPENLKIPEKPRDITEVIKELYAKIQEFFVKHPIIEFSRLVGSNRKSDKIATFIPLLQLSNHNKIDLHQEEHFGEIFIKMPSDVEDLNQENV